ncbi:MAG: hypothetical protein ACI90U_000053 [Pseudomonadales bacterium]|jgi:hypothetical protein
MVGAAIMISQWMMYLVLPMFLYLILPTEKLSTKGKGFAFVIIVAVTLIPVNQITTTGYIRGVTGDISLISLCWLFTAFVAKVTGKDLVNQQQRTLNIVTLCILALVLYPASLGLVQTDPYVWGYQANNLLIVLAIIGIAMWYAGNYHLTLWIALAVLGFAFKIMESTNLWDYIIDAWLAIFVISLTIKKLFRRLRPASK